MQLAAHLIREKDPALFVREVVPGDPAATVIFAHGSMVHSEYYLPLAVGLAERGYRSLLVDLRGHGRSDGARGHIAAAEEHVEDMMRILEWDAGRSDGPRVLGGESYGGLIAWMAGSAAESAVQGLLLVSPAFALRVRILAWQRRGIDGLARVWPRFRSPWAMSLAGVSRYPDLIELERRDPLLCRRYTARFFASLLAAEERIWAESRPKAPVLGFFASRDLVVDTERGQGLIRELGPPSRAVVVPESLHALSADFPETIAEGFASWAAVEIVAQRWKKSQALPHRVE